MDPGLYVYTDEYREATLWETRESDCHKEICRLVRGDTFTIIESLDEKENPSGCCLLVTVLTSSGRIGYITLFALCDSVMRIV